MFSFVFILFLTEVASLQFHMSPRDILDEIQQSPETIDNPEAGTWKRGQHNEAKQIHNLLDTIDQRIIGAMRITEASNLTQTKKINDAKINEYQRLENATQTAKMEHQKAVNDTGDKLSKKMDAIKDYENAMEDQGSAKMNHDSAVKKENETLVAYEQAKDDQAEGTDIANQKYDTDFNSLFETTQQSFSDMCGEIILIAQIRALVQKVNIDYTHPYENPHLGNCRICTNAGQCTSDDFNLDDSMLEEIPQGRQQEHRYKDADVEEECLGLDC